MKRKMTMFLLAALVVWGLSAQTLHVSAAAKTGWKYTSGHWYYYTSKGKATGWLFSGGKWYYLNSAGEMQTGWINVNKKRYYLNPNGDMKTGWLLAGGKRYYLNPGGDMKTGWLLTGGKWYYLNPGGDMKTGWLLAGGKSYYLNPGGDMKTGWLSAGGKSYYLNPGGDMKTGWLSLADKSYYFNPNGEMVTSWQTVGGKQYYFYPSGVMANQTQLQTILDSVPVLCYHSIGDAVGNDYVISPKVLDTEMQWLKDNGYTTLTLEDLYNDLTENQPVPSKSVVLTFDDGYEDNYTTMYPILKKYGFKATIFVITNFVDKNPNFLTSAQIQELDSNGIEIESHTVYHDRLNTLSYQEQYDTLRNSKLFLENILNHPVNFIAYPFGGYNTITPQAAKDAGYTMAFTTNRGWANKDYGIYELPRVYILSSHNMNTFIKRVTDPY